MSDSHRTSQMVKYALLQTTLAPSIVCDLLVFTYFLYHWKQQVLKSPQNHVIVCLLLASFIQKNTDIIFHLYYLRWGTVLYKSYTFCVIWNWLNYSLYCIILHLATWCCVERHLFVFHGQLMKKKWCLIVFHYIPLLICLLYTPILYICLIILPIICTNIWDYTNVYCGGACYAFADPFLGTFDWLFHNGLPALLIFVGNVLLFGRIIWQKIKHGRPVQWKRQKRMIVQLVFISALIMILAFPAVIVGCIQILWLPTFLSDIQYNYFYYIGCFINQLLPFVIMSSIPKIFVDLKRCFEYLRIRLGGRHRIDPGTTMTVIVGDTTI